MIRTPAAPLRRPPHRALLLSVAAILAATAAPSLAGAPTLTTIRIDGFMRDWAAVLANPDNVRTDGPTGGLVDLDMPSDPALDIDDFAFTWDATYLYLYVRREASAPDLRYFWFFVDADNDGLLETGEPVMRIRWRGSNGSTQTRSDTYVAANPAGDPSSNNGVHDGYSPPGTTANGPTIENNYGGTRNGLEMEARFPWATIGIGPGSLVDIHVSATSTENAFPTGVEDNAGRPNYFNQVEIAPDHSATTTPGTTAVFAHTLTNHGSVSDRINLTWTSTGGFTPVSVVFWNDADASGTLTPGDSPLSDGDGDGAPDVGPLAASGGRARILAVVATPAAAAVGSAADIALTVSSSLDPSATEGATDTLTLSGPLLTLVKSVDNASIAPGGVLTYTILFTNTGSDDAQNVVVEDPVPAPATYVAGSATASGATLMFSHDGGVTFDGSDALPVTHLRWTLTAPLPPSGSGSFVFQVLVP